MVKSFTSEAEHFVDERMRGSKQRVPRKSPIHALLASA